MDIILIIVGIAMIVVGMILGFSHLMNWQRSWIDPEGAQLFSKKFLVAMIFDFLGGVSLIIGVILLILEHI